MTEIVNITLDDNTLSEFDSTTGVSASPGAGLGFSAAGLYVNLTSLADRYGSISFTQFTSEEMRTRFYIDTNSLTMASNDSFIVLELRDSTTVRGEVRLAFVSSNYTIETKWSEDSASLKNGPTSTVSDGEHCVEVLWTRASDAGSNDGSVELFIDGASVGSVTDYDTFTIGQIDNIRLGAANGVDAGTSGLFFVDELIIRDDDTEIGLNVESFDPPTNVPLVETTPNINKIVPSIYQSKEFSTNIGIPLVVGNSLLYSDMDERVKNLTYTNKAMGGFWDASFSFEGKKDFANDWLEKGLFRHVEITNPSGDTVWEGFVNQIDVTVGNSEFTVGPLMGIVNRGRLWYSRFLPLDSGGFTGARVATDYAENTDSQNEYGIIEKELSGGGVSADSAENLRDLHIAENSFPKTYRQGSLGNFKEGITIRISLLGYVHLLKLYGYTQETVETVTVDAKIKNVLSSEPNSLISTDHTNIEASTTEVVNEADGSSTAYEELFDGLGSLGDADNNRYIMGVREGRKFYYKKVEESLDYRVEQFGREDKFFNASGGIINSWDVQEGKWVRLGNILNSDKGTFRKNADTEYLETVTMRVPDEVIWSGGSYGKLAQALGRLGLKGING